jgi:UDP-N-acetylglucosamine 2-epimerase (non-hydrolysing)
MRVGIVLGTRPEIIKLSPVVNALRERGSVIDVIHTNQHYSSELDADFFAELELPAPDWNLEVGSGPHGDQTGRTMVRLEPVIERGGYDWIVVQGDTNSAVAGALVAAKVSASLAHVEAGLRSFDRRMPEEVNRRIIDHVSDLLFPPTHGAASQLLAEQVPGVVAPPTGNTVVDAVLAVAGPRLPLDRREGFALLTLHRAENVDDVDVLQGIISGVAAVAQRHRLRVLFPMHPRTQQRVERFAVDLPARIEPMPPTSFRELIGLQSTARLVMTDSGGLQEEACVLGTPCVTLRTTTERPETVDVGANVVAGVRPDEIADAAGRMLGLSANDWPQPLGDGRAGERIADGLFDLRSGASRRALPSPAAASDG